MVRCGGMKVCQGCNVLRAKEFFPRWQWDVGQHFCLVADCKRLHDPRRLRFKELNKDKERQSAKASARDIGRYNKEHNAKRNAKHNKERNKERKKERNKET